MRVSEWSGNVARGEPSKSEEQYFPFCDNCKLKSARIALLGMQETIIKNDVLELRCIAMSSKTKNACYIIL